MAKTTSPKRRTTRSRAGLPKLKVTLDTLTLDDMLVFDDLMTAQEADDGRGSLQAMRGVKHMLAKFVLARPGQPRPAVNGKSPGNYKAGDFLDEAEAVKLVGSLPMPKLNALIDVFSEQAQTVQETAVPEANEDD